MDRSEETPHGRAHKAHKVHKHGETSQVFHRVACLDSSGNQALVKHSSESDLSGSWYHGFRLISRSLLQVPETQNYWSLGTLHRMGQGFPGKGRGSLHKWGLLGVWTPGHPGMHICGKTLSLGVGSRCSAYELRKFHGVVGELWLHPTAPAVPQESPWTSVLSRKPLWLVPSWRRCHISACFWASVHATQSDGERVK